MESTRTVRNLRVFIDSSVLFAAALSPRGSARDLVLLGKQEHLELFVSAFVLDETRRNLKAKASHAVDALDELLDAELFHSSDPPADDVRAVAKVIEVKDAAIVAGALAAGAAYLARYDRRHLLSQADVISIAFDLVVATPDHVLGLLSSE
jgi:predicted nucleic acid-binding protein